MDKLMSCPSCGSDDSRGVERITVTGCGPKGVKDQRHCNICHDDFMVEVVQPFLPIAEADFGKYLEESFGSPKVVREPLHE